MEKYLSAYECLSSWELVVFLFASVSINVSVSLLARSLPPLSPFYLHDAAKPLRSPRFSQLFTIDPQCFFDCRYGEASGNPRGSCATQSSCGASDDLLFGHEETNV